MQEKDKSAVIVNRQSLADMALRTRTPPPQALKRWLRHKARQLIYSVTALRRLVEREKMAPEENKAHWDDLMLGAQFSTYLGGTIDVDGSNAITSLMLKFHAVDRPAILDIGCSAGTLVSAVHSFERYFGTDVSSVAINAARQIAAEIFPDRPGDINFETADLRLFKPSATFDVIVFNEVLYYLNCDQAVNEVHRFVKSLNTGGLIIVSMKDDGKSRAIFKLLSKDLEWVDGILWQRKPTTYDFAIRPNRECPAFMVGALRMPQ